MPKRIMKESAFFTGSFGKVNIDLPKKKPQIRSAGAEMVKLMRTLDKIFSKKHEREDRNFIKRYGWGGAFERNQLCVVKGRFGKFVSQHLRFLEEYLTQQNKDEVVEKPELFSDGAADSAFIEQYKKAAVGKHFKFIISPENPNVDVQVLVRRLIKEIERMSGLKFRWLAAVHTNTNHPHAHLLINGVDMNGLDVNCFRGSFLKQTMRQMCRQICTNLVGPRSQDEMDAAVQRLPVSNRFCRIDHAIVQKQRWTGGEPYQFIVDAERDATMFKRLCHLESLGFARKLPGGSTTFELEKEWSDKLKSSGRYSSFLKARRDLLYARPWDLEIFGKGASSPQEITGRITKLYKMNYEESWDNAVIIENEMLRKAWFVPVYNEPNDKLLGSSVSCSTVPGKNNRLRPVIKVLKWPERDKK